MKQVRVEDAVGMVLCHDMTEIIPGKKKGCAFRKGHIVTEADIEKLLDIGKRHIFVWDLQEGYVHENDAAIRMAKAAAGPNIRLSEPKEGKVNLTAVCDGLLSVNTELLYDLNMDEQVCFSSIHGGKMAKEGKLLAGTRVIPLVVKEETVADFEEKCRRQGPVLQVKPLAHAKIGIVVTGSEVLEGRIQDQFSPVLEEKAKELGAEIMGKVLAGDDKERIRLEIGNWMEKGADMVWVSGGMSVDPDDRTPAAIRACGGEVITYGTPVLPGAMFMLSYVQGIPVIGLPGCVMYSKRTVFDLAVPRILAGERLTRMDFVKMAHGGLCQNCPVCVYPDCGFGA